MEASEHHNRRVALPYTLDSGGVCFFCLEFKTVRKIGEGGNTSESENVDDTKNFFRLILRYLQVNPWKLNPEILKKTKRSKMDIGVRLCEPCEGILRQFGEIYTIFEETVLHLNACVRKIHEVMKYREHSSMKKVGSREDLINFREEIILKCEKKVKSAFPKVRLERLQNLKRKFPNPPSRSPTPECEFQVKNEPFIHDEEMDEDLDGQFSTSPSPTSASDPDSDGSLELPSVTRGKSKCSIRSTPVLNTCDLTVKMEPSEFYDSHNQQQPSLPPPCKVQKPNAKKKAKLKTKSRSKKGDKITSEILQCPYCPQKFKDSRKTCFLNYHLILRHKEHFFQSIRKENITKAEFVKMIEHILKFYIEDESCSLCQKVYSGRGPFQQLRYMKRHIILNHRQTLEKALVKVQDNPELLHTSFKITKDKKEEKVDKIGVERIRCEYCKKEFCSAKRKRKILLNLHLVNFHKEHFFPKIKKEDVTQAEFVKMIDHVLQLCMKNGNCSLCHIKYSPLERNKQLVQVRWHLIKTHHRTLTKALEKLQANPELLNTPFEIVVEEEEKINKDEDANEDDNVKKVLCQFCNKKYFGVGMNDKLKWHMFNQHREQLFPNIKKENVTKAKFIKMIDHVLQLCIKNDNCALCPKVHCNYKADIQLLFVKRHLVQEHQRTLEKALVKVQENPELLNTSFEIVQDEEEKKILKIKQIICQHCGEKFDGLGRTQKFKVHLLKCH